MNHNDTAPKSSQWGALVVLALATAATAALGAFASINAQAFYQSLNQPTWAPPAQVFGPVWTTLFVLMCGAAWGVVRQLGTTAARPAMWWYAAQLACNALWSWLFFRWHLGAWALAEVLLLWVLIAITTRHFWRAHPLYGVLLLPYLAWVSFATVLTWAMWHLNPGVL
jgi:translocator protein